MRERKMYYSRVAIQGQTFRVALTFEGLKQLVERVQKVVSNITFARSHLNFERIL